MKRGKMVKIAAEFEKYCYIYNNSLSTCFRLQELYRLKGIITGLQSYGIIVSMNDNWFNDGIKSFSLTRKNLIVERNL